MAKANGAVAFYAVPEERLQQADVFRIQVVGPSADWDVRVFRTQDGRHGSVVFEENCDATVFDAESLGDLLGKLPARTELHTDPFMLTRDGQPEMVVVYARLFRYFIIASHTCDVSGKDKKPLEWTTILPVRTLADTCRAERIASRSQEEPTTIEAMISRGIPEAGLELVDEVNYATAIREAVSKWLDSGLRGKVLEDARRVRNYLNEYHKKGFLFGLRACPELGLPESCVDFTAVFTVPTAKLEAIKNCRIARIEEPHRSNFSRSFADLFGRITIDKPIAPDPLR